MAIVDPAGRAGWWRFRAVGCLNLHPQLPSKQTKRAGIGKAFRAITRLMQCSKLRAFAVGTRVTSRPPPRSVRAAFPHTAPTSGIDGNSVP
jgi:hypothetical protein